SPGRPAAPWTREGSRQSGPGARPANRSPPRREVGSSRATQYDARSRFRRPARGAVPWDDHRRSAWPRATVVAHRAGPLVTSGPPVWHGDDLPDSTTTRTVDERRATRDAPSPAVPCPWPPPGHAA